MDKQKKNNKEKQTYTSAKQPIRYDIPHCFSQEKEKEKIKAKQKRRMKR